MSLPRARIFAAASLFFFLSGMLGLGYELVWIRKASLVVGSSQIALSTVLTAFFVGLGLGSYFVGSRFRTRRWSPLAVYGLFEASIGAFALAFPELFRLLESAYGALYPAFEGSGASLFALRFVLLFALFVVPTFFMGGTLPLLLDGLVERDASIGPRTSFLYGLNILGAVAGGLGTSYFAIPVLGMDGTSRVFGAGNLAVGAAALAAFRGLGPIHTGAGREPLPRFFLAAAFASGLLAIAYQVAWARYFSLFNTGTVYLTAILLAVYLLALAAGSMLLAPILAARWDPLRILSAVQGLLPLAALWTLGWWRAAEYRFSILGERMPDGVLRAVDTLEIDPANRHYWRLASETADATFFAPLFQVALVVFVPVLLLGAGLPSIIAAAARTPEGLRSVSGRLLFWNTLGSSAGGFAAGYALLPFLGLHYTLLVISLGSLALSAAAWMKAGDASSAAAHLSRSERRHAGRGDALLMQGRVLKQGRTWGGLAAPALGLIGAVAFLARENVTTYTIKFHGYGRDPDVGYDPDARPEPRHGRMDLAEVVEGPLTTSFLFEDRESVRIGSGNVCLAVAYKEQPSSQAIQGHIPALFFPGHGTPENCLGICLGSGQSFGALLLYPIQRLDVVDISSEIVDLSLRRFQPYNHDLAADPRVHFHLDDGRHFVERAPDASYDVVSMEPPPPTAEGVYSLYSFEFYEKARRILRDGGLFMQWLPLYRVTPLDAKGIIKTQAAVFPDTFVVRVFADDFMVVSFKTRPRFSIDAIRERVKVFEKERLLKGWRTPPCRHDTASLEGVLAFLVMGPADVGALDAPYIYHDDDQILSYSSGDRWLLRRYEGPALSELSFTALKLTRYEEIKDYFDPPLAPEAIKDVTWERAASLSVFGVPDPDRVAAEVEALRSGADSTERARRALALAAALDSMLAKDEAYRFVGEAIDALKGTPSAVTEEHLSVARRIVRHSLVACEGAAARWIVDLEAAHGPSPLLQVLKEELAAFRRREAARKSRYWLP